MTALVELALLVSAALALFTLCGLAVAVWLIDTPRIGVLLLPAIGVASLVVVLEVCTLAFPVRVGGWPVLGVFLLALLAALRQRRPALVQWARELLRSWVEYLAAAAAVCVALLPNIRAGVTGPVLASWNNDLFYYLSVSSWLQDHAGSDSPRLGTGPSSSADAPFFGAALQTLTLPMRYGQELVQAWLSSMTGIDLIHGISAWIGAYIAILLFTTAAGVRALGGSRLVGLLAGLAVSASAVVVSQVRDQNADSLLGETLATAAVVVTAIALGRRDGAVARGRWGVVASVLLAGVVGAYYEILPFLLLVLGIVTLIGGRDRLGDRLRWSATVGVGALVLGLPGTWRAVEGLRTTASAMGAPEGGGWDPATLLGPLHWSGEPRFLTWLALGAGLGVVVLAVVRSARTARWVPVGVLALILFTAYVASRSGTYAAARAVGYATPLVILLVCIGTIATRTAWRNRAAERVLVSVALVCAIVWIAVNQVPNIKSDAWAWQRRSVSAEVLAPSQWLHGRTHDGRGVTVFAPTFFDELALSAQLRDLPDVEYQMMRGYLGYLGGFVEQTSPVQQFVDRDQRRPVYALVASGVPYAATPETVIARNSRFALLDLRRGSWAIAAPTVPATAWNYNATPSGHRLVVVGTAPATFEVLASDDTTAVELVLSSSLRVGDPGFSATPATPGWSATCAGPRVLSLSLAPGSPRRGDVVVHEATGTVALRRVLLPSRGSGHVGLHRSDARPCR